jgi:hypothetical protein
MPMTNNPPGDITVPASTAKLSALSGCGWGLIAYFIGHAAFGHGIWGGIVAAPLIGVLMGHLSKSIGAKSHPVQIVASLFDLYLAAMCFAVAAAVFEFAWGPRHMSASTVLMRDILVVLWGLTFTGYFLVLWPLSFFNHRLVWRARATGGVAAPKVGIAAANIRAIALKLIALAVLGYVGWALFVVLTTVRFSATSGMPWWALTDLMGWSNWLVFGSLIWVAAPILATAATRAVGSEGFTTATYGDLIGLVGFAVFVFPFFSFAATLIVMAVKVSLVHSWAIEGTVFWASYHYRNVFWMYLPSFVVGVGLIGVGRLVCDRWHEAFDANSPSVSRIAPPTRLGPAFWPHLVVR